MRTKIYKMRNVVYNKDSLGRINRNLGTEEENVSDLLT